MPFQEHFSQNAPETERDTMRCVLDENNHFVFISAALGWFLGVEPQTLIGKPSEKTLHIFTDQNDESGFFDVALSRLERDPVIMPARIDHVDTPDNKKMTVLWLDPEGQLKNKNSEDVRKAAQDFAIFVDTAANKPAKESSSTTPSTVIQDDGELRHFLNMSDQLMAVYHRDLSFARVGPAFNRTLGFSDDDLRALRFDELIHPDDKARVSRMLSSLSETANEDSYSSHFECRMTCKDGHLCIIHWHVKVVDNHLYLTGHNMTRVRKREDDLQRREAFLEETQKIGRTGYWRWDIDKRTLYWSDQVYKIFGVVKDTFVPHVRNIRNMTFQQDMSHIMRSLRRSVLHGKEFAFEFRIMKGGTSVRHMLCEGRSMRDLKREGSVYLFGIIQDVTERTLHEKALHAAKDAAEHAYASRTRFLANMSHELRTPLNAIIGFSEMMQRQLLGTIGNPRYLDYIGGIRESGEHLLDLINDILDMSKIDVGKYELHVEDLNISKVIRLAVHMIEGRAHEGGIKLITEDIAQNIHIMADRRALMQVLLNLLSNAVKFTESGGTVTVSCRPDISGATISVQDTGIGIPREKISVITQPFEQVDSELTRSHEGSGLGLSITKSLVELHGGTLMIDSRVGIGTTMTVLLPRKPKPAHRTRTRTMDTVS